MEFKISKVFFVIISQILNLSNVNGIMNQQFKNEDYLIYLPGNNVGAAKTPILIYDEHTNPNDLSHLAQVAGIEGFEFIPGTSLLNPLKGVDRLSQIHFPHRQYIHNTAIYGSDDRVGLADIDNARIMYTRSKRSLDFDENNQYVIFKKSLKPKLSDVLLPLDSTNRNLIFIAPVFKENRKILPASNAEDSLSMNFLKKMFIPKTNPRLFEKKAVGLNVPNIALERFIVNDAEPKVTKTSGLSIDPMSFILSTPFDKKKYPKSIMSNKKTSDDNQNPFLIANPYDSLIPKTVSNQEKDKKIKTLLVKNSNLKTLNPPSNMKPQTIPTFAEYKNIGQFDFERDALKSLPKNLPAMQMKQNTQTSSNKILADLDLANSKMTSLLNLINDAVKSAQKLKATKRRRKTLKKIEENNDILLNRLNKIDSQYFPVIKTKRSIDKIAIVDPQTGNIAIKSRKDQNMKENPMHFSKSVTLTNDNEQKTTPGVSLLSNTKNFDVLSDAEKEILLRILREGFNAEHGKLTSRLPNRENLRRETNNPDFKGKFNKIKKYHGSSLPLHKKRKGYKIGLEANSKRLFRTILQTSESDMKFDETNYQLFKKKLENTKFPENINIDWSEVSINIDKYDDKSKSKFTFKSQERFRRTIGEISPEAPNKIFEQDRIGHFKYYPKHNTIYPLTLEDAYYEHFFKQISEEANVQVIRNISAFIPLRKREAPYSTETKDMLESSDRVLKAMLSSNYKKHKNGINKLKAYSVEASNDKENVNTFDYDDSFINDDADENSADNHKSKLINLRLGSNVNKIEKIKGRPKDKDKNMKESDSNSHDDTPDVKISVDLRTDRGRGYRGSREHNVKNMPKSKAYKILSYETVKTKTTTPDPIDLDFGDNEQFVKKVNKSKDCEKVRVKFFGGVKPIDISQDNDILSEIHTEPIFREKRPQTTTNKPNKPSGSDAEYFKNPDGFKTQNFHWILPITGDHINLPDTPDELFSHDLHPHYRPPYALKNIQNVRELLGG